MGAWMDKRVAETPPAFLSLKNIYIALVIHNAQGYSTGIEMCWNISADSFGWYCWRWRYDSPCTTSRRWSWNVLYRTCIVRWAMENSDATRLSHVREVQKEPYHPVSHPFDISLSHRFPCDLLPLRIMLVKPPVFLKKIIIIIIIMITHVSLHGSCTLSFPILF